MTIDEIILQLEEAEKKLKQEAPKNIGKNLGRCLKLREQMNRELSSKNLL